MLTQKLRVYQVAKDFNVSSEALLGILEGLGVPARSHMSTLDDSAVDLVRGKFQEEKSAVKADDARKQEIKAALEREARGEPHPGSVAVAPPEEETPAEPEPVVEPEPVAQAEAPAEPEPVAEPEPAPSPAPSPSPQPRADRRKRRPVDQKEVQEKVRETLAGLGEGRPKKYKKKIETPPPAPAPAPAAKAAPSRSRTGPAPVETGAPTVETVPGEPSVIEVPELASVAELAEALGVKAPELLTKLITLGKMVTINQRLDKDTIEIVAMEFGHEVEWQQEFGAKELEAEEPEDRPEDLSPRPPVVTVMGHVDHGKTSLLDYVRKANVVAGEKGGITQHIGAYEVQVSGGREIAFLDTPGHQAFTAMRARGAKATDIVVVVVAADDRVMPQTLEAVDHAKGGEVPIILAINKIDKPDANVQSLKSDLANQNILIEEFGGTIPAVEISAKTGQGIEELLEIILLQADLLELKANAKRHARGVVIESRKEQGRGTVATVLVQNGTLRVGDPFVCGSVYGKVRAMSNERGKRVKEAGPSTPVEVTGWSQTPDAGDVLLVSESESKAREIGQHRALVERDAANRKSHVRLTDVSELVGKGELQELNFIIKADVAGSAEVLAEQLGAVGTDEVKSKILHSGVGQINESDVNFADASDAIIIGFNVKVEPNAAQVAQRSQVDIRHYGIIYEAVEDVKSALAGLLKPEEVERKQSRVEVRKVFRVSKAGTIAGCYVTEGTVARSHRARQIRDGEVIFEGRIGSLKRFKDDAREVAAGYECGIGFDGRDDLREGDIIESYIIEEVARRL